MPSLLRFVAKSQRRRGGRCVSEPHTASELASIVQELRGLPTETECVEFKVDNSNPVEIGEDISALANSATLLQKFRGYIAWGIEDISGTLVGTSFEPQRAKYGNENLENWLTRSLEPQITFRFHEGVVDGIRIVVLEIDCAHSHPVRFKGEEFIRVGSYKKKLKDHPERERELWRRLGSTSFESGIAAQRLSADEVLQRLAFTSYFDLLKLPLPPDRDAILAALEADELVKRARGDSWSITNVGAVLFAKDFGRFDALRRKVARIVQYAGRGRVVTTREHVVSTGYAVGFEALVQNVVAALPTNEVIEQALRKSMPMFPPIVVREVVANAIIHQDFAVGGAGPMIEIFDDRVEITNPGRPLVPTERFLDQPPRSRNEKLASLMRRLGICEERGSGIDKVVFEIELFQLPAPLFESPGESTRVVLFGLRALKDMERPDRVRACYLHACLRHVTREPMTNASLRARFGIDEKNAATASHLLNEAVESGLVVIQNPSVGYKLRRYLPFWAVPSSHAK
ncbi:MAG: putative DNA binding domain-containing protein [Planctomycetes bacterium]|nr:putative DNA binding domain-containing protein [Planctomycetota bacterium]